MAKISHDVLRSYPISKHLMGNSSQKQSEGFLDTLYRIAILGDVKVGKTAIAKRFANGTFEDGTPLDDHTVEKSFDFNGSQIEVRATKIAGFEESAVGLVYMRTAEGILLVYDITDQKSFDNCISIYENALSSVYGELNCDIPVVLVGNKTDLAKGRVVTAEQGQQLADQHGWNYFETSAKEATNNIDEIFNQLLSHIKDRKVPSRKRKNYL